MSDLNDPRVYFAAERTLMAWSRTGLTLMGFGFVLERFGLFMHMVRASSDHTGRDLSFWIGIASIVLAMWVVGVSIVQFWRMLKTMRPIEIPEGHSIWPGIVMNFSVLLLGVALLGYLFWEF